MDQQTMQMAIEYLDKIGEKIGVTGAQIWPWFVRQQYVEAVTSGILFIVFFCAMAAGVAYTIRNWDNIEDKGLEPCFIVPIGVGLFFLCAVFIGFMIDFRALFNPEYHALKDLLSQIKR
jgi:hypothetical protein